MSGKIIVVDDVATNRALLKAKLNAAYFEVETISCPTSAFDRIRNDQPDLVLLDVMMPHKDGYQLCNELKDDPETSHIPVIMITSLDSTEQRIKGLEVGADDFLSKPYDDRTLIARVRNLMRVKITFDEMRLRDATSRELGLHSFLNSRSSSSDAGGVVQIAASTPEMSSRWSRALLGSPGIEVVETSGEECVMKFDKQAVPDVFLIHQTLMDGSDGLRVLSVLRSHKATRKSAIIFAVEENEIELAASSLDLGASDYIFSPFDSNELNVRVRSQLRRKRDSDRLRSNVIDGLKMAVIDPLTGLYNRRYASQHLMTISEKSEKEGEPYSILMLDLDEFKRVNDVYGHAAGDQVLIEFSRRLQENVRGIDLSARMGGEEFVIAMPGTDTDQAVFVAERLREAIEQNPFIVPSLDNEISITVSIGVASSQPGVYCPEAVLQDADAALYSVKNNGRNGVKAHLRAA